MSSLTYAQLEGLWLQVAKGTKYGTKAWAALMAAIAEAESGGNPNATNPADNGGRQTSWGLWQISLGNHQAPSPAWADPATNAQLALGKLQDQGLDAWGTYTSGAYRAYLSGSTTPDANVPGNTAALTAEQAAGNASDCLYGFGGIPGTSLLPDLLGGSGNVGAICLLSRSQARAIAGGMLVAIGLPVMGLGLGLVFYEVGITTPAVRVAGNLFAGGAPERRKPGGTPP